MYTIESLKSNIRVRLEFYKEILKDYEENFDGNGRFMFGLCFYIKKQYYINPYHEISDINNTDDFVIPELSAQKYTVQNPLGLGGDRKEYIRKAIRICEQTINSSLTK